MGNLLKPGIAGSVSEWIKFHATEKKFSTLTAIGLLVIWGYSIAYFTQHINPLALVLILIFTGVVILRICLRFPLFGLYFTSLFSAFFALPGRFFSMQSPIGILVEVFTWVLWIAVLRKSAQNQTNNYRFWNSGITVMLVILMLYYMAELANPAMQSKIGWLFFVRKQVSYLLVYFIAFSVLNSYRKIQFYLRFWLALAMVIALYGIKQQWFGLAPFEKAWLQTDPTLLRLYFQAGFLRKFSFITDPAAFGILCSCFGLFSLVMAIRIPRGKIKYLFYFSALVFFLATAYSGTRTCLLMVGAGLIAYGIMTINEKRTYILLLWATVALVVLLIIPYGNSPVVNRVKTIFLGTNEASLLVRNNNRRKVQPYIQSHPFGGGINTSGMEGQLYNSTHILAGFPPDSGYLKILLEQGAVGFAINLLWYFFILKEGIMGFYNSKKQAIKNIYIALTVWLFALIVGQYSQISIAQYPLILFYYAVLALLIRLKDFDKKSLSEM